MNSNNPKHGMNIFMKRIRSISLFLLVMLMSSTVIAAPTGGNVIHGGADISSSGGNTIIDQNTDKAIINWDKFNIGANESVRFNQKNSQSVVLNRVTGGARSEIFGKLSANGNVFLLNSNGILIGNGASINVGSFMASTGAMSDKDFMNGNYRITGAYNEIINKGEIRVNNYGFAALLSRSVVNEGLISAHFGRVDIASGDSFTLNFYDNQLIGINIDKGIAGAYISNSGEIAAEGGTVYISAKGLSSILNATVNNEGVIRADSLTVDGGKVVISVANGDFKNTGKIDVSSSQIGGSVNINADNVIHSGSIVANGDVRGGIIFMDSQESTTLTDGSTAYVNSIIGKAGDIRILSNGITSFNEGARLFSTSVDGNGGFVEVSAVNKINFHGKIDLSSVNKKGGQFLLDPRIVHIIDGQDGGNADITYINLTTLMGNIAGGDVSIIATADIFYEATEELGDTGNLKLEAGRDITITNPNIKIGTLELIAGGNITITNPNITIGTLELIAGGNITITGGNITVTELIAKLNGSGSFISGTTKLNAATLNLSAPAGNGSFTINNLLSPNAIVMTGLDGESKIGGNLSITTTGNLDVGGIRVNGKLKFVAGGSITNQSTSLAFTAPEMDLTAGAGGINLALSDFNFMTLDSGGTVNIVNETLGSVRFFKMNAVDKSFTYAPAPSTGSALLSFKSDKSDDDNYKEFKAASMDVSNSSGTIEMPFLSVADSNGLKTGMRFVASNTILYDYSKNINSSYSNNNVDINDTNFFNQVTGGLTINVPVDITINSIDQTSRILTAISSAGKIDATDPIGIKLLSLTLVANGDVDVDFYGAQTKTATLSVIAGGDATIKSTALNPNTPANNSPISILTLRAASADVDFTSYGPNNSLSISDVSVTGLLKLNVNPTNRIVLTGDNNNSSNMNVEISDTVNTTLASLDILNNKNITLSGTYPTIGTLKLNSLAGDIEFESTSISADTMWITGRKLITEGMTFTTTSAVDDVAIFRFSDSANFKFEGKFIDLNGGDLTVSFNSTDTTIKSADRDIDEFSMTGNNIKLSGARTGLTLKMTNTANVDKLSISSLSSFVLLSAMITDPAQPVTDTVLNARILNINVSKNIYVEDIGGALPVINSDRAELVAGESIAGNSSLSVGDLNNPVYPVSYLTLNARLYARLQVLQLANENVIYVKPKNYLTALRKYEFIVPAGSVAWMYDSSISKAIPIDTNMFGLFQIYKDQFFLPLNDLYDYRQSDLTAYDNLLQLGGDMITSDIKYPRHVTALYKINKKVEIK